MEHSPYFQRCWENKMRSFISSVQHCCILHSTVLRGIYEGGFVRLPVQCVVIRGRQRCWADCARQPDRRDILGRLVPLPKRRKEASLCCPLRQPCGSLQTSGFPSVSTADITSPQTIRVGWKIRVAVN